MVDQPVKLSKSGVLDIEAESESRRALHRLLTQPHLGTQPGDGCTIVMQDGERHHGHYTETGWEID